MLSLASLLFACVNLNRQETWIHLTLNALKIGLISAQSAARREKDGIEDTRLFCHFTYTKLNPYQNDLLYVRVMSSSYNELS